MVHLMTVYLKSPTTATQKALAVGRAQLDLYQRVEDFLKMYGANIAKLKTFIKASAQALRA